MISCTEFIPLYSEFFKYLEKHSGSDAVMEYWIHISDTVIGNKSNPNSLAYKCEKYGGFDGAIAYWGHTLTEEACDLLEMEDHKNKVKYSHMRRCPSRGMLNELSHVQPYHDYCSHCNVIYARVLEKYGIVYERDNSEVANAECRGCFYEKGRAPDFDFRRITDDEVLKMGGSDQINIIDMKREDNKYLHRDFHISADNALRYCSEKYGREAVVGFLTDYVRFYYAPVLEKIKKNGLEAFKEWIEQTYATEEASELLHTELSDGRLTVTVDRCPVIEYIRSLGQEPSDCFIEETRTVYAAAAEECGYSFELEYYNDDGGARFVIYR